MQKTNEYISIGKAAKLLEVSVDTLRRWEREGKIRSIRYVDGGNRFFKVSELLELNYVKKAQYAKN